MTLGQSQALHHGTVVYLLRGAPPAPSLSTLCMTAVTSVSTENCDSGLRPHAKIRRPLGARGVDHSAHSP